jgi:hypothetical protein
MDTKISLSATNAPATIQIPKLDSPEFDMAWPLDILQKTYGDYKKTGILDKESVLSFGKSLDRGIKKFGPDYNPKINVWSSDFLAEKFTLYGFAHDMAIECPNLIVFEKMIIINKFPVFFDDNIKTELYARLTAIEELPIDEMQEPIDYSAGNFEPEDEKECLIHFECGPVAEETEEEKIEDPFEEHSDWEFADEPESFDKEISAWEENVDLEQLTEFNAKNLLQDEKAFYLLFEQNSEAAPALTEEDQEALQALIDHIHDTTSWESMNDPLTLLNKDEYNLEQFFFAFGHGYRYDAHESPVAAKENLPDEKTRKRKTDLAQIDMFSMAQNELTTPAVIAGPDEMEIAYDAFFQNMVETMLPILDRKQAETAELTQHDYENRPVNKMGMTRKELDELDGNSNREMYKNFSNPQIGIKASNRFS